MNTWTVRQSMPTKGRTRCGGSEEDLTQVRHLIERGGDHGGLGPKAAWRPASDPLCHSAVAVSCTPPPNVIFDRAEAAIDGDHVEQ